MVFDLWILYVAAISFVILIPGPLSLFMMHNSISYGIVKSYPAFVGGSFASSLYLIISATGLGMLLTASENLFSSLKLLGALYLIYVGLTTIKETIDSRKTAKDKQAYSTNYSKSRLFNKAFLLGASNPEDIIFFMAFIPQFVTPGMDLVQQIAIIVMTWVIVDFACKLLYGLLGRSIRPLLFNGKNMAVFNTFTGGLYIFAGVAVSVKGIHFVL